MPTVTERYLQTTSQPTADAISGMYAAIAGTLIQPIAAGIGFAALNAREATAVVVFCAIVSMIGVGFAIWGAITAIASRTYRTEFKRRAIQVAKK